MPLKIKNFELKAFYKINSITSKVLDIFFRSITHFGHPILWITVEIISLFLGYYYLTAIFVLGLSIDGLISATLQIIIRRKRPFKILDENKIIVRRYESSPSFPSAHTERSFFIITVLLLMYLNYIYPYSLIVFILYPIAIIVGISRIYLGAHFPLDVIGGAILGIISAFLYAYFLQPFTVQISTWIFNIMLKADFFDKIIFLIISMSSIFIGLWFYEKSKEKHKLKRN